MYIFHYWAAYLPILPKVKKNSFNVQCYTDSEMLCVGIHVNSSAQLRCKVYVCILHAQCISLISDLHKSISHFYVCIICSKPFFHAETQKVNPLTFVIRSTLWNAGKMPPQCSSYSAAGILNVTSTHIRNTMHVAFKTITLYEPSKDVLLLV